jgi:hypothetical protein
MESLAEQDTARPGSGGVGIAIGKLLIEVGAAALSGITDWAGLGATRKEGYGECRKPCFL